MSPAKGRIASALEALFVPRDDRPRRGRGMPQRATIRRSIFKGAETGRLTEDFLGTLLHPDDELHWNIQRLRARGRDLSRNSPIIRQFLNMLAVNAIGPSGFDFQSQVRDNDGKLNRLINKKIEDAWHEWSESPTVDGRMNLEGYSRLLLKTVATDGDVFVREWFGFSENRFGFALESIDADQVDETFNQASATGSNEVRMGVEINSFGRPVAYHVWNRPQSFFGSQVGPRKHERIAAAEVLHLYEPNRVNQTRGVTWFHPILWAVKMLDGYSEAELVAARTAAAKMGWFTKKQDASQTGAIETLPGSNEVVLDANPGTFDFAPDGYELTSWSPDHPTTAFGDFMKAQLRQVATGLGVSYPALANDLESVNYSSMRSGLLIEREVWRTIQNWWVRSFLRRVHRDWLNMALLNGALVLDSRDASKFYQCRFNPRGWAWVDPLKDAQAGLLGIQTGLTSRTRLHAEQGTDFEEVLEELKNEKEAAGEAGVDVSGPAAPITAAASDDDEDAAATKNKVGAARPAREQVLEALAVERNGRHT